MSFLRHGEIYHFDEGAIPADHALAHRNDEFPAGYSLAGCTPAEPASASPAGAHFASKRLRSTIQFQRTANSVLTVCLTPGDNPRSYLCPAPRQLPFCGIGIRVFLGHAYSSPLPLRRIYSQDQFLSPYRTPPSTCGPQMFLPSVYDLCYLPLILLFNTHKSKVECPDGHPDNLHWVWDTGLLQHINRNPAAFAAELESRISPQDKAEWLL